MFIAVGKKLFSGQWFNVFPSVDLSFNHLVIAKLYLFDLLHEVGKEIQKSEPFFFSGYIRGVPSKTSEEN